METIVNSLISSYLAEYLVINPEKTKLSILEGTVELQGVKFKKTLFATLNLPYLELVDGYIGKIFIQLSLSTYFLFIIYYLINKNNYCLHFFHHYLLYKKLKMNYHHYINYLHIFQYIM